jgi:hypothetical protein
MGLQQDADKTPNQDNRGADRSNGSPSVCVVGTLTETKDLSQQRLIHGRNHPCSLRGLF